MCLQRPWRFPKGVLAILKVTILLPTYKRPILIRRSLDSIFNQTLEDWELIVIENGSNEEMHESYQMVIDDLKDMHDVSWLTFDWASLPRALNEGLERAKGEYLSVMEDDDEWEPQFLEKMGSHLDNCTCGMVYCKQLELDPSGSRITAGIAIPKRFGIAELIKNNFIGLPMCMYRTSILQKIGFDEKAGIATDWIAHCMIYRYAEIHALNHTLVTHYWHPEGDTPNYCITEKDETRRYTMLHRKYLAEGKFDPQ